jgi:hypothetical protein
MITGQGAVLWLFSFLVLCALAAFVTIFWILTVQRKRRGVGPDGPV